MSCDSCCHPYSLCQCLVQVTAGELATLRTRIADLERDEERDEALDEALDQRCPYEINLLWVDLQAQVDFEEHMRAERGEHLVLAPVTVTNEGIVARPAQYLETSNA